MKNESWISISLRNISEWNDYPIVLLCESVNEWIDLMTKVSVMQIFFSTSKRSSPTIPPWLKATPGLSNLYLRSIRTNCTHIESEIKSAILPTHHCLVSPSCWLWASRGRPPGSRAAPAGTPGTARRTVRMCLQWRTPWQMLKWGVDKLVWSLTLSKKVCLTLRVTWVMMWVSK